MATFRLCPVPGCIKSVHAGGLCAAHYWRWKTHGDPLGGATSKNAGIEFINTVATPFNGDECLRWPISLNKNGYGQFGLNGKMLIASRYVCEAAHGLPPTAEHHAAHNCGNRWCVNPKHLRWATPVENNADKLVHDTHNKGERHGKSKLTADMVLAIRALAGTAPQTDIAARFGVCQRTVSLVIRRERWNHI